MLYFVHIPGLSYRRPRRKLEAWFSETCRASWVMVPSILVRGNTKDEREGVYKDKGVSLFLSTPCSSSVLLAHTSLLIKREGSLLPW